VGEPIVVLLTTHPLLVHITQRGWHNSELNESCSIIISR